MDMEKVKKRLECCSFLKANTCRECPYRNVYGSAECAQMAKDALELLKEQEPVKPIERNGFYYCGSCRYALMTNHQKYCSDCGKKVKWDG